VKVGVIFEIESLYKCFSRVCVVLGFYIWRVYIKAYLSSLYSDFD